MNEINKEMEKGKSPGWIFAIKIPIFSPKSSDSPEDTQASAKAKPAPSRIMTSHANFCWTSFHLTKNNQNISVENIAYKYRFFKATICLSKILAVKFYLQDSSGRFGHIVLIQLGRVTGDPAKKIWFWGKNKEAKAY